MAPSEFGPAQSQSSQTGTQCCSIPSQTTPRNCTVHRKLCTHCKYFYKYLSNCYKYRYTHTLVHQKRSYQNEIKQFKTQRTCLHAKKWCYSILISVLLMRCTIFKVVIYLELHKYIFQKDALHRNAKCSHELLLILTT